MDDLAPAPAQWISGDAARESEQKVTRHKRAPKKLPPPSPTEEHEADRMPESEPGHQLDILA